MWTCVFRRACMLKLRARKGSQERVIEPAGNEEEDCVHHAERQETHRLGTLPQRPLGLRAWRISAELIGYRSRASVRAASRCRRESSVSGGCAHKGRTWARGLRPEGVSVSTSLTAWSIRDGRRGNSTVPSTRSYAGVSTPMVVDGLYGAYATRASACRARALGGTDQNAASRAAARTARSGLPPGSRLRRARRRRYEARRRAS